MSENRPRDEEEYRDFLSRMEQEFQQRNVLPPEPAPMPYRDPQMATAQPYTVPQQISFSLAQARPRAMYVLLAANVVMYILTDFWASQIPLPYIDAAREFATTDPFTAAIYIFGAKFNPAINAGQWWRLLTPMFLHGSLLHLAFNSWALYALGPQVESTYGTARFVTIYALAGLAGSIASYAFNADALSVGASGAIFGLFGTLAAFAFTSRSLIGWEASKMQLGQMATLVAINLAFGFVPGSNIDNSAHIGGLVVGGLLGLALAPRYAINRQSYPPSVVRQDNALVGWGVAGITLLVLAGWFLLTMTRFGV